MQYHISMKLMPQTVSSKDIQTSYKVIFEKAMRLKEPIVVLKNNKPQVAIIDYEEFEKLQQFQKDFEYDNYKPKSRKANTNKKLIADTVADSLTKYVAKEKLGKSWEEIMEETKKITAKKLAMKENE